MPYYIISDIIYMPLLNLPLKYEISSIYLRNIKVAGQVFTEQISPEVLLKRCNSEIKLQVFR